MEDIEDLSQVASTSSGREKQIEENKIKLQEIKVARLAEKIKLSLLKPLIKQIFATSFSDIIIGESFFESIDADSQAKVIHKVLKFITSEEGSKLFPKLNEWLSNFEYELALNFFKKENLFDPAKNPEKSVKNFVEGIRLLDCLKAFFSAAKKEDFNTEYDDIHKREYNGNEIHEAQEHRKRFSIGYDVVLELFTDHSDSLSEIENAFLNLKYQVLSELDKESPQGFSSIEYYEKYYEALKDEIEEKQKEFQERYEQSKTVEESSKIQEEWQEYLKGVGRSLHEANQYIIGLLNEEVQRRVLAFEQSVVGKPMKEVNIQTLQIRIDSISRILAQMNRTIEEKIKEFSKTLEKATLKDKGDRLVAAGADIPSLHEIGTEEIPEDVEVEVPNPVGTPKEPEIPPLNPNDIVAVVAFAFANVNENSKFKVSCNLKDGFIGLSESLKADTEFQSVIRISQIFVAAGLKNVVKNADGTFTFDVVNGDRVGNETAEIFAARIGKVMGALKPAPEAPIETVEKVVSFFDNRKDKSFEDIRQEIFQETTGCQSYVVNEVRQLPGGLIEKRLTTDGDPRLPGCGSHSIVTPKKELVTITNWINSDKKDKIKVNSKDEKDLDSIDIKSHPFKLELVHDRNPRRVPKDVYVLKTTDEKTVEEFPKILGKIERVDGVKEAKELDQKKREDQGIESMITMSIEGVKITQERLAAAQVKAVAPECVAGEYYEDCTKLKQPNPKSLIRMVRDPNQRSVDGKQPTWTSEVVKKRLAGRVVPKIVQGA